MIRPALRLEIFMTMKRQLAIAFLYSAVAACGSDQPPPSTAARISTGTHVPSDLDSRALALGASLAATGNYYPTPPLFVKRWNLLTQWAPGMQITAFTSKGHENNPRPIAELEGFDFVRAETILLEIGASGRSIEYATLREDPANIGTREEPNSYTVTRGGFVMRDIAQLCIWEIRSTRSSFTLHEAVQLLNDALHAPLGNVTNPQRYAENKGVRLTVMKGNMATCEVREAEGN
jgi:hypothetical protein